jgi:acyl-CoA synthetase (AMP-forming)/AMP-acid ligase II
LLVTGPGSNRQISPRLSDGSLAHGDAVQAHVGCGHTFGDTRIAIVDPVTREKLPEKQIGEIWITGASCAQGYWNRPDETAVTFHAHLDSGVSEQSNRTSPLSPSPCTADRRSQGEGWGEGSSHLGAHTPSPGASEDSTVSWLRTGDLGMIVNDELFITVRLRELIIIAGRNFFPIDLEREAEASDPAIAPMGTAAFSIDVDAAERLIIVAEVRREYARPGRHLPQQFHPAATARQIRVAIAAAHDVTPFDVQLLAPGALPRTSSGKIMRYAARQAYLDKTLELLEVKRAPANV